MKTTALHAVHRELGARLVEFGGFEMPVQYGSIVEEHKTVRTQAGLFDLCHMGRFEFRGPRATAAVNALITNDVDAMHPGQIRYALMLNDQGGVRDDVLVYRLPDRVWLVVNAGNRDKLLGWIRERMATEGVEFVDRSEELAMIAVQGPAAESILLPRAATTWVASLGALGYYKMSDVTLQVGGAPYAGWVSRTGYTGEDGFELYVPSAQAPSLWGSLLDAGAGKLRPCGLGARDTLRLEAGMPLYGHELDEDTNPLEAGLDFAIKLDKAAGFIGAKALKEITKRGGPARTLRGFAVDGKRIARQGMPVFSGDKQVGVVTSGAPSPTLERNIALAYIAKGRDAPTYEVDVRGTRATLIPHPVPFYSRTRKPAP